MSKAEQRKEYTPKQIIFRELRDTLSLIYSSGVVRPGMAKSEATVTVNTIATYFDEYIPARDQKKLLRFSESQSDYYRLRGLALAVSVKQNELKKMMKKGRLKQNTFFNEELLNDDNLLVVETIHVIDQYLNRA